MINVERLTINDERLTNAKVPIPYQDAKQISENEGKHVIKHTRKFEFRFRGFVAAISPRMVENVVENFLVRRLDVSDFGLTFAEESRNDIIHCKLN